MMLLQSVLNVEKQISQSVTFMRASSVCKNNSTKASSKSSYTVVDNITVCALLTQYQYFYFSLLFSTCFNHDRYYISRCLFTLRMT